MILPDFLKFNESGLYCRAGDFYLDPQQPVMHAVISHAHGDHARRGNSQVYATRPTAVVMQHRFKKNAAKDFHLIPFHQPFTIGDVHLTFIPAGHILGSAQVLMEYQGVKYLYTGDYKLQHDEACEPIEFVKADVLITETTFADPKVQHPDPVEEIKKLNEFPHNVLLGAYALGKSQRLIHLIYQHCPQRKILVHHSILPLNKIYESFSFLRPVYEPYNRRLMKDTDQGLVYIVPPMTFNSYFRAKNVVRVFASGWQHRQEAGGLELFVSDHADWNDILYTIEQVQPSEVWTLHGSGKFLKQHFEGRLTVKIL